WKDETDRRGECSEGARLEIADPHHDLRRERPRHRLPERNAIEELLAGEPGAPLDEVALHVTDRGDWAAEAPRPQAEEVSDEPRERNGPARCSVLPGGRG